MAVSQIAVVTYRRFTTEELRNECAATLLRAGNVYLGSDQVFVTRPFLSRGSFSTVNNIVCPRA